MATLSLLHDDGIDTATLTAIEMGYGSYTGELYIKIEWAPSGQTDINLYSEDPVGNPGATVLGGEPAGDVTSSQWVPFAAGTIYVRRVWVEIGTAHGTKVYIVMPNLPSEILTAAKWTLDGDPYFEAGGTGAIITREISYPQPGEEIRAFHQAELPAVYVSLSQSRAEHYETQSWSIDFNLLAGVVVAQADAQAGHLKASQMQEEVGISLSEAILNGYSTWLASGTAIEHVAGEINPGAIEQDEENPHLFHGVTVLPVRVWLRRQLS